MPRSQRDSAYDHSGFAVLRTALLPLTELTAWSTSLAESSAGGNDASSDNAGTLRDHFGRPLVSEALFLASPTAHHALTTSSGLNRKMRRTLGKYLSRMVGRSTPFGLFAGCSLVKIAKAPLSLRVSPAAQGRRDIRLDHDYLYSLADAITMIPALKSRFTYLPNSSLYRSAGRWKYVRTAVQHGVRQHVLMSLDADEYLDRVVEAARDGAKRGDLAECVVTADSDGEITLDEATEYIGELIDRQVLKPDLSLPVTGPDALDDLVATLTHVGEPISHLRVLTAVNEELARLRSMELGCDPARYQAIREQLVPLGVEPDLARLFQIDLHRPAPEATCSVEVVDKALEAVNVLHRISPPHRHDTWRRFKDAFVARYEGRQVPLAEALDPESGIAFDSQSESTDWGPLLQGLHFSQPDPPQPNWTTRDTFLLERSAAARHDRLGDLRLTEDDLQALNNPNALPLPDAFSVTCIVGQVGDSQDPVLLIRTTNGPSGANLLGRFCQADPELTAAVKRHLAQEEQLRPEVLFAELVHLPDGRVGNVIARPVLRSAEIAYLGRSGASRATQLYIADLLVSVEDDRVVLRSATTGREILPRKTNAHNHSRGQTIYRFLASLAQQNVLPWLSWSWGALETACSYLPRVVYQGTVLARRRWRFESEDLRQLTDLVRVEGPRSLDAWRARQLLPRFVVISEADNELLIDFDNHVMVDVFLHQAKKHPTLTLFELFPNPEELAARSPDGRLVSELVIPYVRRSRTDALTSRPKRTGARDTPRVFLPGSSCFYTKWYAGTSLIDRLLTDVVPDLSRVHGTRPWFFVRYGDPEWHLRLRFLRAPDDLNHATATAAINAADRSRLSGEIWKFQVDTYQREVERYGGDQAIALAEAIFWRDSEAALKILTHLRGDAGADTRWRVCMKAWDMTLSSFGLSASAKREFARSVLRTMSRQLRPPNSLDPMLAARFRLRRKSLEQLLFGEPDESLRAAVGYLAERDEALRQTMQELFTLDRTGQLCVPVETLPAHYLHMTANRLLRSDHRWSEFVMYDMLTRLYDSHVARRNRNQTHSSG